MKKKDFKHGKALTDSGITLVALVVTIIVLLVLAGVSLNLVSGSNGILGRASSAANKNTIAKAGEEVELLMSELQSEYYEKVYVNRDSTVTEKTADEYVINHLDGVTTASGFTIDVDGTKITVKDGSDVIASNEFMSAKSAELKTGWTGSKIGKTSGGSHSGGENQSSGGSTSGESHSGEESEPEPTPDPPAPIEYTIAYNANAGTDTVTNMPSNQTKTKGENLTLSSSTPTRSGYTFKGWATSSTGNVVYTAGGNYTTDEEVTLYACWNVTSVDLYNNGTIHDLAGDFVFAKENYSSYVSGTFTKNSNNLYFYKSNSNAQWADGGFLSSKAVDVTGFNTLTFYLNSSSNMTSSNSSTYSCKSYLELGIGTNAPSTTLPHDYLDMQKTIIETPGTVNSTLNFNSSYDVDLTGISGKYYIGIKTGPGYYYGQTWTVYVTGIKLH